MTDAAKHIATKRITIYVLGLIVMALGISMSIRADIGVAPGSTIPYVVSKISPVSVGMCTALFNILCVLIQLAVTRRLTLKLVLQFPIAYVFGFLIDLFNGLFPMESEGMAARVLLLIAGMFVFSLGIRAIVGSDLMLPPSDGLARTAGNKFGWPMSRSKLTFDIIVTAIALLLTLIFAGRAFLVVSVGTVICAAGTGPIIGLYTKLLPFLDVREEAANTQA